MVNIEYGSWFLHPSLSFTILTGCHTSIYLTHILSLTHFYQEDEGSMFLWNAGNYLEDYTLSQPRRPRSTFLMPWKLWISDSISDKGWQMCYAPGKLTSEGNALWEILCILIGKLLVTQYILSSKILPVFCYGLIYRKLNSWLKPLIFMFSYHTWL